MQGLNIIFCCEAFYLTGALLQKHHNKHKYTKNDSVPSEYCEIMLLYIAHEEPDCYNGYYKCYNHSKYKRSCLSGGECKAELDKL